MRIDRARVASLWLALVIVLGLGSNALAQTGAASITGLLTDQSGAATPGVTVTATNQATNVPYTAISNSAGNYTITSVPVGSYVVKAELTGFKTPTTKPLHARSQADRAPRPQAGARARSRTRSRSRPRHPSCRRRSATVGEVISGKTRAVAPAQRPQHRPARAAGARRDHGQPARVHRPSAASAVNRPYVNGNREQTNNYMMDGVDVNETIDNRIAYQPSPDALAEISVETNNYAADVGNVAGAVISNVHQVRREPVPRQRVRVLPQQRLRREHLGEQPVRCAPPGAQAAHLRRHAGRPADEEQAVLLRQLPGLASGRARLPQPVGGAGGLAPRRPLEHHHADPRSRSRACPSRATRFPPAGSARSRARHPERTANYPYPTARSPASTGNFVGETLFTTRAHQGDLRLDWNASAERQALRAASRSPTYEDQRDSAAVPAGPGHPERSALPERRRSTGTTSSGRRSSTRCWSATARSPSSSDTLDWAGIGNANATYGIPGGQPIAGTELDQLGRRPHRARRHRHRLRHPRQDLPDQREAHLAQGPPRAQVRRPVPALRPAAASTPATTACSASSATAAPSRATPFSDFLLDQVGEQGPRQSTSDAWTHLQNRISLFVQDDFKVTPDLTLNLGLRWAYTSPLVEKDNRQSNFDLVTGAADPSPRTASIEDRALYKPYYKGFEPRLGFAWSASDRLVFRGGYGISQYMEGTGANLRLPLNPPFFFESDVTYDATTGAGHDRHRLHRPRSAGQALRQRPRLRSEPPPAVHPAVERRSPSTW